MRRGSWRRCRGSTRTQPLRASASSNARTMSANGSTMTSARNAPCFCSSARSLREESVPKASSALLGAALDRHRAARRDPLMTRAGAIFALLTGGAFAGLDQAFGDDDELQLVGMRRNGESVRVKALSEGTRDQLYFALRLAVIENYAARSEA